MTSLGIGMQALSGTMSRNTPNAPKCLIRLVKVVPRARDAGDAGRWGSRAAPAARTMGLRWGLPWAFRWRRSGHRRSRPPVAQRGLDARRAPRGAATRSGDLVAAVELVGDRLEAQPALAQLGELPCQLGGPGGQARPSAWTAVADRLALPALDFPQHRNGSTTLGRGCVQRGRNGHELSVGLLQPAEQAHQLGQRMRGGAELGQEQDAGRPVGDVVQCFGEADPRLRVGLNDHLHEIEVTCDRLLAHGPV